MSEQSKSLLERSHLAFQLILDLSTHERKLLMHVMRHEVAANLDKLDTGLVDLAVPDELTRRVGHEGGEADEEDDAPGDLEAEGQTPLDCSVVGVAAEEADPVAHHGAEGDAAAGNTADGTSVLG